MIRPATFYTETNLPSGFTYDSETRQIYSPVTRRYAVLNADGTVVNTHNIVFERVDDFVHMQLSMTTEAYLKRRDRVSEPFQSDYRTVSLGSGNDCIIKKETLALIIWVAVAFIFVCIAVPPLVRLTL